MQSNWSLITKQMQQKFYKLYVNWGGGRIVHVLFNTTIFIPFIHITLLTP